MEELSLERLRKLNSDSVRLNGEIQQINALLDECHGNIEGMADITDRVGKVFALYRELVREMENKA